MRSASEERAEHLAARLARASEGCARVERPLLDASQERRVVDADRFRRRALAEWLAALALELVHAPHRDKSLARMVCH
jgi:hypothetical protein